LRKKHGFTVNKPWDFLLNTMMLFQNNRPVCNTSMTHWTSELSLKFMFTSTAGWPTATPPARAGECVCVRRARVGKCDKHRKPFVESALGTSGRRTTMSNGQLRMIILLLSSSSSTSLSSSSIPPQSQSSSQWLSRFSGCRFYFISFCYLFILMTF